MNALKLSGELPPATLERSLQSCMPQSTCTRRFERPTLKMKFSRAPVVTRQLSRNAMERDHGNCPSKGRFGFELATCESIVSRGHAILTQGKPLNHRRWFESHCHGPGSRLTRCIPERLEFSLKRNNYNASDGGLANAQACGTMPANSGSKTKRLEAHAIKVEHLNSHRWAEV